MKISRPSPALIVSIIALVVACAGTATAARVLITSSSQIKNNVITSADVRNGSLSGRDLRNGTITEQQLKSGSVTQDKLAGELRSTLRAAGGVSGFESFRRSGPEVTAVNKPTVVATLQQLPAGTYAIFAKSTIGPGTGDPGLLGELLQQRQGSGHCVLDAGGDVDDAREAISAPGQKHPSTVNLQITRTIGAPTDIKLTCDSNVPWKAADSSIIAIALGKSQRAESPQ